MKRQCSRQWCVCNETKVEVSQIIWRIIISEAYLFLKDSIFVDHFLLSSLSLHIILIDHRTNIVQPSTASSLANVFVEDIIYILLYFCTILHCFIRPIKHFPPLQHTLPLSLHTNKPITTLSLSLSLYRNKIFLLHINLRSFLSFFARWFLFRVRTCTLVLLEGRKEPEKNQFLRLYYYMLR